MQCPTPPDEAQRLQALRRYPLLERPEASFDRITRLAVQLFGVPKALITFVEEDRQWFKSRVGFPLAETPREVSFCAHAIQADAVMVVEDAGADARFRESPLVTGPEGIRFYAGAPLVTADGYRLGTLCIADVHPRTLGADEQAALADLAAIVVNELELRREVAERQQAEAALAAERAFIEGALDTLPDLFFVVDPEGRFLRWNRRARELTGYTDEEVAAMQPWELFSEADAARITEAVTTAFVHGEATVEAELATKDGRRIPFEFKGAFVPGGEDGAACICGTGRDITERREALAALQASLQREKELSDLKSRFVSMVSHEFRTPLATILSSCELVERYRHRWDEERTNRCLNSIRRSVHGMTELLEDVLVLGKAEAGRLTCSPRPVDLRGFLTDFIEEVRLGIGARHHLLLCGAPPPAPVQVDPKLLRLVLNNVLSNAIKYSPEDSIIRLTLEPSDGAFCFTIEDEGIGIPEQDLPYLFEPFRRGENAGVMRGTGLGLAIAKRAIDLHGGCITLESLVGQGTTVTVVLPTGA